jgi:hypothetical protein
MGKIYLTMKVDVIINADDDVEHSEFKDLEATDAK